MTGDDPLDQLPRVAILGDSRVFDTYFVNPKYGDTRYGYQSTFPHLLRRALLRQPNPPADVVHIPDHFRGGTIESNIVRLALTDPAMVVLVDGIWETLLNKGQFLDHVTKRVTDFDWQSGDTLDLSFSSRRLVDLFLAGELDVSPTAYADKQAALISFFARRRRRVVWANLPVVPRHHLNRVHYAGNHVCLPEWDEVLSAVNDATERVAVAYGARVLDLHALMEANGGPAECLIDQWHFSRTFHRTIADALLGIVEDELDRGRPPSYPIMPGDPPGDPVAVMGEQGDVRRLFEIHPQLAADTVAKPGAPLPQGIGSVVLAMPPGEAREAAARRCLGEPGANCAIVYPEELAMHNPPGNERAQHGRLRSRNDRP